MIKVDRERLEDLLRERGRSARDVSLKAGLGATAIKDILSGKSRDPGIGTMIQIAHELGVDLNDLFVVPMEEHASAEPAYRAMAEVRLPIRHEVAAGGFIERDDVRQQSYGFVTVRPVRPYDQYSQWLERVVSDSMDKLIPPGSLIHVVDAIELRYKPRAGDVVVVERRRAQGALVERTVKQIGFLDNGRLALFPRSHNPNYRAFTVDETHEDVEVVIVGLVIRSYQMLVPGGVEDDEQYGGHIPE